MLGRTCITAFTSRRTNLSPFTKGCRERDASMWLLQFLGEPRAPNNVIFATGGNVVKFLARRRYGFSVSAAGQHKQQSWRANAATQTSDIMSGILAEGAMTLPVTLSGGVLFASWKLLQFPSSLIVKVILAIFTGASAQRTPTHSSEHRQCLDCSKLNT